MGCGDACPYVPTTVQAWDIPDPAGRPLDEVRDIRDLIERHVRELVVENLPSIRGDRTAHELRLAQLLPDLADEFHGLRADEDIRACADAVLGDYDEAPVRSYVLTLARRRTRDCLRAQTCDPAATTIDR
jgi:hypothetical protein